MVTQVVVVTKNAQGWCNYPWLCKQVIPSLRCNMIMVVIWACMKVLYYNLTPSQMFSGILTPWQMFPGLCVVVVRWSGQSWLCIMQASCVSAWLQTWITTQWLKQLICFCSDACIWLKYLSIGVCLNELLHPEIFICIVGGIPSCIIHDCHTSTSM